MKKNLLNLALILTMILANFKANSQETTVGLLSYDVTRTYEGYNLIYPHNQPNVYLLNMCGEIAHSWTDSTDFRPGNTAYLRPDGTLVKTKRSSSIIADSIWAGGGGAIVEIRSWDNDLIWSFEMNNPDFRLHHDVAPMPNGNILMLAWERKKMSEAVALGRDPALLNQGDLWPEYIFEINPNTDEIVWEWHVWDHLVQDVDDSKPNFGVIADHKELVNINYDDNAGKSDWMHSNALDFSPELNQIMLSVPTFNELWIIDHSTTTAQAATHVGGRANHGGDLIYRFGNLAAYEKGDSADQILFYQHDAHWADDFLSVTHPHYGKIVAFNNRVGADFSTVEIFESSWEMYVGDYTHFQGAFPPFETEETITHPTPQMMYSTGLSSAQVLQNGNILICNGRTGYLFELTPDDEIVWEYRVPLIGGMAVSQGDSLSLNNNLTFRVDRYPTDYQGFVGKNLDPKGWIENDPIEDYCGRLVSTSMPDNFSFSVYPNPADDMVHLTWDTGQPLQISIHDLLGRRVKSERAIGGMVYLDVSDLQPNIYFLRLGDYRVLKLIVE